MGRLTGKTAIITGAARGIGAIMANKMAQEGAPQKNSEISWAGQIPGLPTMTANGFRLRHHR